ncbi:Phosphorylase b kinase gamma catalytic chain, skeletal muscle/heart isoform [Thelohanellus kitauei]|uniref:Phosphorylase b kinase gamma catalytic chain, skeletal muscle/heart isoform n=1 Tax=Thelohanellus kitauei TaxID=669202 RepID=A0A0C2J9N9_THEKT|nr:Phosphorylase b kinase gamma catalytic chain, skeletal muscle/heart isoform [Thelohanellus kitauei]
MTYVEIESLKTNVKFVKEEGFYAKYTTSETLGYGLTSVVQKCTDQETLKEYAVKIIERNSLKDLEVNAEISALSQLSGHPNIVRLVDHYCDENYYFLVFELAQGGELFEILKNKITLKEQTKDGFVR